MDLEGEVDGSVVPGLGPRDQPDHACGGELQRIRQIVDQDPFDTRLIRDDLKIPGGALQVKCQGEAHFMRP